MGISKQTKIQILLLLLQKKKTRHFWVHPINKSRRVNEEFFSLVKELEEYPLLYFKYFRMPKSKFDEILSAIEPCLKPHPSNIRKDFISSKEKLVVTLRFLATGTSYADLAFRFKMGHSTVHSVVKQTLAAIIKTFLKIASPSHRTQEYWKNVAKEFLIRWNLPNCCGAADGKHSHSFAPDHSSSLYFNYKKSFSTNLMAVVDAQYKFIMINIGGYGSNSDSTVFSASGFGKAWLHSPHTLNIPEDTPLPGTTDALPYVLIADEGFALKPTIMRPFPVTPKEIL